jgi:hypothetical protein
LNTQESRQIVVVVQLGATEHYSILLKMSNALSVKIYVAGVEVLRKNEIQDETQFTTKIDGFLSFIPR